jgi:hypothetical protein
LEAMDPWNGSRAWPTTSPTRADIAPTSMASRRAESGPCGGDGGIGRPGRADHQEALFAELGKAHQQGVPSGPPRLQRLRRSAQDRGLYR